MTKLNNGLATMLFLASISAEAKGLGELAAPKPAPKTESSADDEGASTKPTANDEENAPTAQEKEVAPPEKAAEKTPTRTELSSKLENRLTLDLALGWGTQKPKKGKWEGTGLASVGAIWALTPSQANRFSVGGKYKPLAGTLYYENRYYDCTMHGLILGAYFDPSIGLGTNILRVGLEGAFFKTYAKPQDGDTLDSEAASSQFSIIGTSEFLRPLMDKFLAGPFLSIGAGTLQSLEMGFKANFLF